VRMQLDPIIHQRHLRDRQSLIRQHHSDEPLQRVRQCAIELVQFFLETIALFGHRYGMPPVEQPPAGVIPTIMMRAPRLNLVEEHYPEHVVYQIEAPFEEASARIHAAGGIADDDIRVTGWKEERALGEQLADRVIKATGSGSSLIETIERALTEDFGA